MPDIDPQAFPVTVTTVGSATSYERGYQMGHESARAEFAAVLDALNVEDLRSAVDACRQRWPNSSRTADRLDAAADALHALEADQTNP